MRCPDDDKPVATSHVIDAVWNGDAIGIAGKVIDANVDGCLAPRAALVFEPANKLPLLGIYADDRLTAPRKRWS